jgi:hypothetical protein
MELMLQFLILRIVGVIKTNMIHILLKSLNFSKIISKDSKKELTKMQEMQDQKYDLKYKI